MKFSDLLGEPEPERDSELTPPREPERSVIPPVDEPIGVFAPVPTTAPPASPEPPVIMTTPPPPMVPPTRPGPAVEQPLPAPPLGGRSGLAELNVRQEAPPTPPAAASVLDQLAGLDEVVDDLLPSARHRARK